MRELLPPGGLTDSEWRSLRLIDSWRWTQHSVRDGSEWPNHRHKARRRRRARTSARRRRG